MNKLLSYGDAIRHGFEHLLATYPEVFVLGQGLWSPWYVGNTMTDLDKRFGKDRIIDTPVSELACTGAAVGASLCGYRAIVVHPRMDFMLYAMDAIVNQAAKWSHMVGGQAHPAVTIRAIINRGGEQGAQHSQALHAWFAHIPGLRVVMPSTPADARDLLVASVLCDDPVVYIDDRWLYETTEDVGPISSTPLQEVGPIVRRFGSDVTLVGCGWTSALCASAALQLADQAVSAEVIDARILNPFDGSKIIESVAKTGRLCVVDGGWRTCGFGAEVIAAVAEHVEPRKLRTKPARISLPDSPAPSSGSLEALYYPTVSTIVSAVRSMVKGL